ncbi:MAG TPA: TonB family protein [Puia sp.]|nr:TonB family protein [Puia sp.]
MDAEKVLSASILDIIFEHRNKEYGAYELRSHHNRRVITGLVVMAGLTGSLFIIQALPGGHQHSTAVAVHITDVQLEEVQPEKNLATPPPPPPPIQLPKIAQIKFTAPRIVKDEEVKTEDRPPEQEKLQEARIGMINEQGIKDSGMVGPPSTGDNGKGIVQAPQHAEENNYDKVFTKVEIESQYPGGNNAWLRYLNKNFRYPEDAINNNVQGTVMVQFIVDKIGNVSDVEAVSGPETGGLREEAVRVIRKSGQWTPAIQNGAKVKSYKRQPVVFRMAESQ